MTRWSYPLFQGFQEFFIRPAADAGFRIACNIRCIENPERGFQRPPTGEWLAVVLDIGMAAITPSGRRKIGTLVAFFLGPALLNPNSQQESRGTK